MTGQTSRNAARVPAGGIPASGSEASRIKAGPSAPARPGVHRSRVSPSVHRARRRFVAVVGLGVVALLVIGTRQVTSSIGDADGAAPSTVRPVAAAPAVRPVVATAVHPATSAAARRPTVTTSPIAARVATPPVAARPVAAPPIAARPVDPATGLRARPDDPNLPASGTGRRVVYSIGHQRVWLVGDDNAVQMSYRVSGGRHEFVSPGRFHVYSASRHAIAWDHESTMQWMVRFAKGPETSIGFHDLPKLDSGGYAETPAQLGIPLSDGCVRQAPADAKALFDFAPVGTRVVVTA